MNELTRNNHGMENANPDRGEPSLHHGPVGGFMEKISQFVSSLVDVPHAGRSSWYIETGEASSIVAGSDAIENVNVSNATSGGSFTAGVEAFRETHSIPANQLPFAALVDKYKSLTESDSRRTEPKQQ